jgi:DNA damage-binding protein 1
MRANDKQTEGSLYLLGTIAPSSQDLLIRLQSRLAELVQTPGNIPWASYRSFRNAERETEEPWRFVDGELVERFLDLEESVQEEVCRGLVSVQDGRDLVEGLRRMH